jgi:hypothetical protein
VASNAKRAEAPVFFEEPQTCFSGVCTSTSGSGGGTANGGGTATGGGAPLTGGGGGGGGGAPPTGGGGGVDCAQQVTEVNGSGGCVLTLVSPANCATVNFGAGVVELAYTTNFTFCEGPHHLFLLGNPPSTWNTNAMDIELTSTGGNFVPIGSNGSSDSMTRDNGGVLRLVRADLAPLQSPNGQYHFTVTGFYALNNGGSRAGSRTFFVP